MPRFQDRTVNLRGAAIVSAVARLRLSIRLPSDQPLIATVMEWLGFLTGVTGATVLALRQPWSAYGWLAFLTSNMGDRKDSFVNE
jgi:CDP-diglyceride synthetase